MPDSAAIGCVSWDKTDGWLCCGAVNGLVKIIHIEQDDANKTNVATFTLDGHQETGAKVIACCWNEVHHKLTTTDESGHIIVWMNQSRAWQEEMVNNRQCSVVSDMHWAPDGSRICIAYHDGAVIVGKVDGTRVWGKAVSYTHLTLPTKA